MRYQSVFGFFCAFFIVSGMGVTGHAEEATLGEVRVSTDADNNSDDASHTTALHDKTATTYTITAKDLSGRRTNLTESLESATGIQIRRYGGLDDFATIAIRGSTSEQVAVYVDGILLNQGTGGAVNLASIPADQVERVEIYKGAAPAHFGSSAIGGVVNIVTKKTTTSRRTSLTQSFGSYDSYETTLSHGQNFKRVSYDMGYSFSHSRGDFAYLNDNGTPFNPSDDHTDIRTNNALQRHTLLSKGEYRFANTTLRLQNQFFREDRGVPGLATLTAQSARLATTREGLTLEWEQRHVGGAGSPLTLTLTPTLQFQKTEFSDPAGEIGLGVQDTDNTAWQFGTALRAQRPVGTHQIWTGIAEYRGEIFQPHDVAAATQLPDASRHIISLGLEDQIFLLNDRLIFNPSIRSEHLASDSSLSTASTQHPISGKLGFMARPLSAMDLLTLKTNLSRSYRLPSFSELFGDAGSVQGNGALSPESGLNWDIGARIDLSKLGHPSDKKSGYPLQVEVTYFLNHIDDLIQFLQTSQSTVKPQNLSSARIQGVETSWYWKPLGQMISPRKAAAIEISGSYTFQWAKDTSGLPGRDGLFLPGRPLHEVFGRLTLRQPTSPSRWGDWQAFSEARFLGQSYLDTANLRKIDGRLLINAGLSVKFMKRFTASMDFKNIFNNRISDIVGFPLPGRSYYGKLEVKI